MTTNDNSVNIKSTYHHGDLNAAVMAAAIKRLESGHDFSLREVARDIGVSATAIYRHFHDKDALLDALAFEAAEMMGTEQMAASAGAGGGKAGFSACGRAYVNFALNNPAMFRLMGSRAQLGKEGGVWTSTAMRFLYESVDGLMPNNSPTETRDAVAMHAWSLVHGLALLMLDGHITRDPKMIDAVIDAAVVWN